MRKFNDLSGARYGRLLVKGVAFRKNNSVHWNCRCDCGTEKTVASGNLNRIVSCGCFHKENLSAIRSTHRMSGHPIYLAWQKMRNRCKNPHSSDFKWYGARGISICDRWESFEAFNEDMGPSWQAGLTIERVDVNGDYRPGNCRWATQAEQLRNTTRNIFVESPWGRICAADAADKIGISRTAFLMRLKRNWPPHQLFSQERHTRWTR